MKLTKFLAGLILVTIPQQLAAWGQKGHDTTAFIAENHLTEKTKGEIDKLLDGKSIVYWSNWLDNASHTQDYEYSITWHYKNIDADRDYDKVKPFKTGDVVTALNEQLTVLSDTTKSKEERSLALKIVVHLFGDLHQPMHLGHASDRGGNYWNVRWFKNHTNLHSVWDSRLPEAAHKWSYTEWRDQIDRATPEEVVQILSPATPDNYGRETWSITTEIYNSTPKDSNLEYTYIADWTPTVERQFLRGGLRLADALNKVFDEKYTSVAN